MLKQKKTNSWTAGPDQSQSIRHQQTYWVRSAPDHQAPTYLLGPIRARASGTNRLIGPDQSQCIRHLLGPIRARASGTNRHIGPDQSQSIRHEQTYWARSEPEHQAPTDLLGPIRARASGTNRLIGPGQSQSIRHQQTYFKVYRPEPSYSLRPDPPACNQKGITVIWLAIMHAVCCITFMYTQSLYVEECFYEIECLSHCKHIFFFLNWYTLLSHHKIRVPIGLVAEKI